MISIWCKSKYVVQGLTFAVPLVSFLVDWPVGTVFIAVAFPFFEHMVEARPVLVGSYFSRRLCIVNPPDGMLPLNLTIDPMLPVLMLQIQLCNTCGNGVVTLKVGLSYFAMNRALLRTRAPKSKQRSMRMRGCFLSTSASPSKVTCLDWSPPPTAYFDARTAGFAALVTPSCRLLAHTSVVYDSLPCGPT